MLSDLSRRRFLVGAGAATLLGATGLRPARAQAPGRPTLPIPRLIDGSDGVPIQMRIRSGEWEFLPGLRTPTFGFGQDYLGPTLRTRRGTELNLRYENGLDEGVSVHGHGLHVPGAVDGGPQLEMPPGESWHPTLNIVQPAATCWYHSHTHGRTGHQTYHGLAGLMIIDDDDSDGLPLPRRYGVDDLPVIIQDKKFDSFGKLVYSLHDAEEDGWYGDTVTINGALAPIARVPAGKVRLRLLNGANARFFVVAFADGRTFHKIATDGGLLAAPVPLQVMEMAPGERCEIIVDLSNGRPADLLTLFEDEIDEGEEGAVDFMDPDEKDRYAPSLTLSVDAGLVAHTAALPTAMTVIERPAEQEIKRTRDFMLTMDHEPARDGHAAHSGHGGHQTHADMDMAINGAAMDMGVINERVEKGVWERWRVRTDQGAHPFHVHGCSFLIEEMEGEVVSPAQQGWKDMVVADDDAWSSFLVRFDHEATEAFPYMYHCHILEHEDRGMMGQFTVT